MQCQYFSESVELELESRVIGFQSHFGGCMEMYSDAKTVANYLDAHENWFCRCAEPMKTEPIGNNGYILAIGKYGSLGYEVEPKIAIVLDPPLEGVYKMYSIPIPGERYLGYQVDYQAFMRLEEIPSTQAAEGILGAFKKQGLTELPTVVTQVTWQLHLTVMVRFPKLIDKLPMTLIQKTGDRLLSQIIRQVSPRLSVKVQQDFHHRLGLPLPLKNSRQLYQLPGNRE